MLTKYATIESILEVKTSKERLPYEWGTEENTTLQRFAALESKVDEQDGYLYVKTRAISSRVNKNNDGWPSEELSKSYKTFIGRPVFVDHNNDDPKRTRGVIVDSKLHVEDEEKLSSLDPYYSTAPDNHKPPTWIELLIEVDSKTFPKLAEAIRKEDIDAVSMGANIKQSVCSVCANEATVPDEFCDHIKKKGLTFEVTSADGEKVRKKAYEDCIGVDFFEISFVFDPADDTALIQEKTGATTESISLDQERALDRMVGKNLPMERVAALKKEAYPTAEMFVEPVNADHGDPKGDPNFIPQSDKVTAPEEVNTLRSENLCPICRASNMEPGRDGIMECPTCGHVQEPEPLNNPDLSLSQDQDLQQNNAEQQAIQQAPTEDEMNGITFTPSVARKQNHTEGVISEMKFTTILETKSEEIVDRILPITAAVTKPKAKATILPTDRVATDDPKDGKVISDQLQPVESAVTINISDEKEAEEQPEAEVEATPAVEETVEAVAEAEEAVIEENEETQEVDVEAEKEAKLLAAFRLADKSVEMGLVEPENKMVFIAELEEQTMEALKAREATLDSVRTAGLKKEAKPLAGIKRIPRLSHTRSSLAEDLTISVLDEQIFL